MHFITQSDSDNHLMADDFNWVINKPSPKTLDHLQFTKYFEDKWSLIFLVAIPIIEVIRYLLHCHGTPKLFKTFQATFYNVILPQHTATSKQNLTKRSICPDASICKKIFSFHFVSACRRTSKVRNAQHVEEEKLLLLTENKIHQDDDIEWGTSIMTPASIASPVLQYRSQTHTSPTANKEKVHDIPGKPNKMDMSSLNTYDLFKIFSTVTMFIDHYGCFGLPGLTFQQNGWTRVIGRTAAPGFFFLAGYSSKKFRMKTWCAAWFVYLFTSVVPLKFVLSPWESVMHVALINCIYYYIPPHRIHNTVVHVLLFMVLQHYRQYASNLNIGYGTAAYMLSIAGDLIKHKHFMGRFWVVAAMISFGLSSVHVFSHSTYHTVVIATECAINAVIMIFFKIIEISIFNKNNITQLVRDGLIWISRTGLLVYIGHLCLFRIIQLCKWDLYT
eukprot:1031978_1